MAFKLYSWCWGWNQGPMLANYIPYTSYIPNHRAGSWGLFRPFILCRSHVENPSPEQRLATCLSPSDSKSFSGISSISCWSLTHAHPLGKARVHLLCSLATSFTGPEQELVLGSLTLMGDPSRKKAILATEGLQ